jgi:serpin B
MFLAALALAQESSKPIDLLAVSRRQEWFAFASLRHVAAPNQNTALSPSSILYSLAGLLPASTGESRKSLARVLGLQSAATDAEIGALKVLFKPTPTGKEQIESAAAVWVDDSAAPDAGYVASIKEQLGFGAFAVDLQSPSIPSTVNAWISEQTRGRIPYLLSGTSENTQMLLTSALYYKAPWRDPMTIDRRALVFGVYGQARSVRAISTSANLKRMEFPSFRAVAVPLDGDTDAEFYVPKRETLPEAIADHLATNTVRFPDETTATNLRMPFWKAQYFGRITDLFRKAGLAPVLVDRNEFPKIGPNQYVLDAVHRSWIDVNERGIEAAAATVVSTGSLGAGRPRVEDPTPFEVDRPFLFVLRNRTTGAALFTALVYEPLP